MIQSVNHVALLPLYAAAGTAVLVLVIDLLTGRRGWIVGSAVAGGLATAACAIGISGRTASTFCTGPGRAST